MVLCLALFTPHVLLNEKKWMSDPLTPFYACYSAMCPGLKQMCSYIIVI